jgi:hypothetical protein
LTAPDSSKDDLISNDAYANVEEIQVATTLAIPSFEQRAEMSDHVKSSEDSSSFTVLPAKQRQKTIA